MSDDAENMIDKLAMLKTLRDTHRALDSDIAALHEMGNTDMLKIARMKKQKLKLKDQITAIEEELNPDIIA